MGLITYYRLLKGKKEVGEEQDIDKSYFELSEGLDALGLDGNYIVIGATGADDSSDEDSDGFYEAALNPAAVKKNWQKLKGVAFKDFYAAFKKTDLGKSSGDDLQAYLQAHFDTLKEIYQAAARQGAGLRISAS